MRARRTLMVGGTGVLGHAIATAIADAGDALTIATDGRGPLPAPAAVRHHEVVDRNAPDFAERIAALSDGWDLVIDVVCYNASQARSLHAAIGDRTQRLIAISSGIIYDHRAAQPLDEDAPLAPEHELGPYGVGKAAFETYWRNAVPSFPVTILRLPHVIGRGCELGIIPLHNRDPYLLPRLTAEKPLLLVDGGEQLVQAVFASDVAAAILRLAEASVARFEILNCAHPQPFSALTYFELIASAVGQPLRYRTVPLEALRQSEWGWAMTAVSRVLSVANLETRVPDLSWTPLSTALNTAIEHLRAQSAASYNDVLRDVETALVSARSERLVAAINRAAHLRLRTAVDVRMNAPIA